MMEQGSVRNLEQIQESDGDRTPRGVTILLVALGGACIVFAGLAIGGRRSAPTAAKVDPLGELVTQQAKIAQGGGGTPAPKATDLSAHDVTFPGILSDEGSPTTALAAVKGGSPKPPTTGTPGAPVPPATGALGTSPCRLRSPRAGRARAPSMPVTLITPSDGRLDRLNGTAPIRRRRLGDRRSVTPLPAQNMLGASPVVTRPRDSLTRAASDAVESAVEPARLPHPQDAKADTSSR